MQIQDQFSGFLLRFAASDAVGTTLEFKSPGTFKLPRQLYEREVEQTGWHRLNPRQTDEKQEGKLTTEITKVTKLSLRVLKRERIIR